MSIKYFLRFQNELYRIKTVIFELSLKLSNYLQNDTPHLFKTSQNFHFNRKVKLSIRTKS